MGLAEWEVWSATTSGTNAPPQITSGPTANPTSITSAQSSTVSVTATDADGDALSYSWQATGGTVNGFRARRHIHPPFVSTTTTFRVDVFVADGRGGVANGFVNITVNPTPAGSNIALSAVATASAENTSRGQTAAKAIDGFVDRVTGRRHSRMGRTWTTRRGVDSADLAGRAECRPRGAARSHQHQRSDPARLRFSDGSTIPVGTLPNDGVGQTFDFNAKSVTWVRLEVLTARGDNTGLAEFEGVPADWFLERVTDDLKRSDGEPVHDHRCPDDDGLRDRERSRRRSVDLSVVGERRHGCRYRRERDLYAASDHAEHDVHRDRDRGRWTRWLSDAFGLIPVTPSITSPIEPSRRPRRHHRRTRAGARARPRRLTAS